MSSGSLLIVGNPIYTLIFEVTNERVQERGIPPCDPKVFVLALSATLTLWALSALAQGPDLEFSEFTTSPFLMRIIVIPTRDEWKDRIQRALNSGFPYCLISSRILPGMLTRPQAVRPRCRLPYTPPELARNQPWRTIFSNRSARL